MTEQLAQAICKIQEDIRNGRYLNANEAAVSQGVIIRVLTALSWPTFDHEIVFPEYSFEGGRVDFALCHPRSHPVVLLEIKRIGKLGGAELQLFQYAFHQGTQLVILTDGAEWHFYLPGEKGDYHERKLCIINLASDSQDGVVSKFMKYLGYESTCLGRALESAREDYRASPQPGSVAGIQKLVNSRELPIKKGSSITYAPIRFKLYGIQHTARNRQEVIKILFDHLAEKDPDFLDHFTNLSNHGAYRKYLGRSPDELYPGNPERAVNKSYEFRSGWFIPGGLGTKTMHKIIEMVSRIKDFKIGRDIIFLDSI
jgi:hypothetical protein